MTAGQGETAKTDNTHGIAQRVLRSVGSTLGRAATAAREHQAILIFLSAIFVGRLFLAPWNSYWNDEILSVVVYGIWNDSAFDAVQRLADNSIHPPLYQFILYNWMDVFGNSETVTRTLSNVYVTLAAFFLYLIVKGSWSKLVAFFSAAGFSVMSLSTEYALEARSYAQTIFLVTLSSWFLLRLLARTREAETWSFRALVPSLIGLVLANTALIMTHYYNVFWLLAQAGFVLIYLILEWPRKQWRSGLLVFFSSTVVAPLVFFVAWGGVFIRQYQNRASSFEVEGTVARNPLNLLANSILSPNIATAWPVIVFMGALVTGVLILLAVRRFRSPSPTNSLRAWSFVHLALWLVLPLLVVYAVFSIAGVERYSPRYFVFCLPPLSALLIITLAVLIELASTRLTSSTRSKLTASVAALLIALLFVPTGYDAATSRKHDWRGNIQRIVQVVEANPEQDYFILETGFNAGSSRADYYFSRMSRDIRVDAVATRSAERTGNYSSLLEALPDPDSGTEIILFFNHSREMHFPKLMTVLDERYRTIIRQLDNMGRGYIVLGGVASSAHDPEG